MFLLKKDNTSFFHSIVIRRSLGVVLLLLLPLFSFAQRYNFTQYTIEDGLYSSEVVDMVQDHYRYIWIATPTEGVIKFDGVEFKQYREADGLVSNYIQCIYRDKGGNIWMGTKKGITMYNGYDFHNFTKNLKDPSKGLPDDEIQCIEEYNKSVYVGTKKGGLAMFKGDGFSSRFAQNSRLSRNIKCLFSDSKGRLWIGGDNGLAFLKNEKITAFNMLNGLPDNNINDIIEVNGEIWIATNNGLSVFKGDSTFVNYSTKNGLPHNNIFSLAKDQDQALWAGTGKGAAKYYEGQFEIYDSDNGLTNNPINKIILDSWENTWFGTKGAGLYKFAGRAFTYYTKEDGIKFDNITAVLIDEEDYKWYGTLGGGIYRMRHDTLVQFTTENGLPSNQITSLSESADGKIWVGTPAGIAKIIEGKIYKVEEINIIDENVSCLYEDLKGVLWIGTRAGVTAFDGVNSMNYSKLNGLSSNNIRCIGEDDLGLIWIGTFEGLNVFDGKEFLTYTAEDGLPSNVINAIVKNPSSNSSKRGSSVWIGTDKGLVKFENDAFKVFTTKDGLGLDNISLLQFDGNNCLWVGSMRGVDRIFLNPPQIVADKTKKANEINFVKHYDITNGFKGMGTNKNAVAIDEEGQLFFGTFKGIVQYNTNVDDYSSYAPKVIITSVQLEDININWRKYTEDIERWTMIPKGLISLGYNNNNLIFKYIGIDHTAPEKVKYSWRLTTNEVPGKWTIFENRREAIFSNLEPGDYVFEVKAENADLDEEKPAIFRFRITPPFWSTLWFKALSALLIAFAIFGYIKWRERKLRSEREILENKVKERTEELMEQKRQMELVNLEVISKNKEIEDKNNDLNSSIRYALTIQQSYFPALSELHHLNDSFIYHAPRDIVSGDFYWFKFIDDKMVISISDCTGHGVPGAFMSLIGMTLLDMVIAKDKILNPAEALKKIDRGIIKAFENSDTESNDGMDMALVTIDFKMKKLYYAGAFRPLWFVHNGEITEYKATKTSLGGSFEVKEKDFELVELDYEEGDCIYMSSDGYADQFGGEDKKKFKSKTLKEMLLSISQKPMSEQKEIVDHRLIEWKGILDQVDDVLVFGARL